MAVNSSMVLIIEKYEIKRVPLEQGTFCKKSEHLGVVRSILIQ